MPLYLVRIDPTSPLHIGEPGIGVERCLSYIPSDTLFGAICNAWAAIYGRENLETLLNSFPKDNAEENAPPFILSSAFPRLKELNNEYFFFPKPFSPPPEAQFPGETEEDIAEKVAETMKDTEYLEKHLFENWIGGTHLIEGKSWNELMLRVSSQEDGVFSRISKDHFFARVRLDRIAHHSQLYFFKSIKFSQQREQGITYGGGLFFLASCSDDMKQKLHGALKMLGDSGIGGERSLGYGRFSVNIDYIPDGFLREPEDSNAFIILSLHHPTERDLQELAGANDRNFYDLAQRGGWIDSPFIKSAQRKLRCRMLREGSVLGFKPTGKLANVTPAGNSQHAIYRYGIPFTLKVRVVVK